ncbi:IS66 family insertion sequence element accessory protein TnpA [Desulfoscipio geothermicus]|uniref:Uncharacterized protein n=1 Tax=Desulfoscipio geothermicus DSM 3669 TaxID=1121426 RepID=A0A1I6DYC8_9FIRM|nr:hypothetical protein [Desulfoscipio geothermicus]SFR10509.1 hypothetical protein SAMN05660706_12126 [Desulfoscipio geothermicus DSM 3669]
MTRAELRKEWEARVAAFRASDQSASTWCTAHDLKPISYDIGSRSLNPKKLP